MLVRLARVKGIAGARVADREERLEIGSRYELQNWLAGNPVDWAQSIAVRAALRVIPLVFRIHEAPDGRAGLGSKQGLILLAFRTPRPRRFLLSLPPSIQWTGARGGRLGLGRCLHAC